MEYAILIGIAVVIILLVVLIVKSGKQVDIQQALDRNAEAADAAASRQRMELSAQLDVFKAGTLNSISSLNDSSAKNIDYLKNALDARILRMDAANKQQIDELRDTVEKKLSEQRNELTLQFNNLSTISLETISKFTANTENSMEALRNTVNSRLSVIEESNKKQLDEIKATVDQKLTETVSAGIDNSFKTVSEQLAAVSKSIGEMQSLATGISDLNKVLANVKTRGTWGEVQLGRLIEDILAPNQYVKNIQILGTRDIVEYAVKLPGSGNEPVYMPIDSKFPMDKYIAVLDAQESADASAYSAARHALSIAVLDEAKKIHSKYVLPPRTTDFAVMFVPSEGLYAQIASMDLLPKMQNEQRVLLAGPSTLSALLNSLQVGFKTLAIEQQSVKIMEMLGAVKKSLGNLSLNIEKTLKSLHAATNHLEHAQSNSRTLQRKLKDVEELGDSDAKLLLGDEFFTEDET